MRPCFVHSAWFWQYVQRSTLAPRTDVGNMKRACGNEQQHPKQLNTAR
jgi:hypothetical protein